MVNLAMPMILYYKYFSGMSKGHSIIKRLKLIELKLGNYTQIEIVFITSRNTENELSCTFFFIDIVFL